MFTEEKVEATETVEEVVEEVTEETEKPKKEKKEKKLSDKELLVQKEEEITNLKDQLLRNQAEMVNFKNRMKEEQIKDRKYASANLITDLITPLEYLTKACQMQTDDANLANFLIGFKMIASQITDVLKADGLVEVDSLNNKFDPTLHHAVENVKVEGAEAGVVVEELSKAYKYKDRILKPAMVKVSE
ncbi:MAG: nucleotide exchange factor GrpE [bacterium]